MWRKRGHLGEEHDTSLFSHLSQEYFSSQGHGQSSSHVESFKKQIYILVCTFAWCSIYPQKLKKQMHLNTTCINPWKISCMHTVYLDHVHCRPPMSSPHSPTHLNFIFYFSFFYFYSPLSSICVAHIFTDIEPSTGLSAAYQRPYL